MELESLQSLTKSPEWGELVRIVKAQNIARERSVNAKIHMTSDDTLAHNYELGFIHGQRNVIALPLQIIAIRMEEFHALIEEERENDQRTATARSSTSARGYGQQYDPEQS